MATWKKVVWAIPAVIVFMAFMFSQLSYARIISEQSVLTILPRGNELSNVDLLNITGDRLIDIEDLLFGAFLGAAMGYVTSMAGASPYIAAAVGLLTAVGYWAGCIEYHPY